MRNQVKSACGALLLAGAVATATFPASAIEFVNGAAAALTGDSITVGGVGHPDTTLRLWAIQAPEMTDDRDYGLYARAFLDDLLRQNGGQVQCVTDSFDRSSAVCHAGAVDLGEAMLRTGWAVADRVVMLADVPGGDSERSRRAKVYLEAESQARRARKGRWAKMP